VYVEAAAKRFVTAATSRSDAKPTQVKGDFAGSPSYFPAMFSSCKPCVSPTPSFSLGDRRRALGSAF
jgi:hypothetical protein